MPSSRHLARGNKAAKCCVSPFIEVVRYLSVSVCSPWSFQGTAKVIDSSERWFGAHGAGGKPLAALGLLSEITEESKREERLQSCQPEYTGET